MQRDGFAVGYMKPVSVSAARTSERVIDEDAQLIHSVLNLDTPIDKMVPVAITATLVDSVLRGQTPFFEQMLKDAYRSIAHEKDVMVLEGSNNWAEGALVDLTADRVIDMLDAPGLLITRYESIQTIDTILTVQRYIGKRLMLGVLLNQVEEAYMDDVRGRVVPFLESHGIPVFGVLPKDRLLASVPVQDLVNHLGGQLIGKPEWCNKMVESLMIGSMGSDAALSFLRRRANKAVIIGGDRIDFQLVALETSINLMVLTGNIRPSMQVLGRAEEREVPILVVPEDTLSAVEKAEQLFGHVPFHQPEKLERFTALMDQHFNYGRLYNTLGIAAKK
jgi:hypothetical protein